MMPTIRQQFAARRREMSTPQSYAAFLRRQGFSTEQVAAMVARSFNRTH